MKSNPKNPTIHNYMEFLNKYLRDVDNPKGYKQSEINFIKVSRELKYILKENFNKKGFEYLLFNIHQSLKIGHCVYAINTNYLREEDRIRYHTPFQFRFYWIVKKIEYGCEYHMMNSHSEYESILHHRHTNFAKFCYWIYSILYTHSVALHNTIERNRTYKLTNTFINMKKYFK